MKEERSAGRRRMKWGEIPKKPIKYLIHVKTNKGKPVNSRGTKNICRKRGKNIKLNHKVKDKNIP